MAAIIITPATTPVTAVGIALGVIALYTTGTAILAIAAAIAMSRTTRLFPIVTIAGNG